MEDEFKLIRQIIQKYPYVSLVGLWKDNFSSSFNFILYNVCNFFEDTEFPGVVLKPLGEFETLGDYQYQKMRLNVHALKLIQVGFTFMDEKGQVPPDFTTWQFNFKFSIQ